MPVRESADSVRLAIPFFPTSHDQANSRDVQAPIVIPQEVAPVFDQVNCSQPIAPWDDEHHNTNYTEQLKANAAAEVPPEPKGFNDKYLMPTLTKNERQRLTMLWYYTRNIQQDPQLLQRLNEKISLVREFMGWEFAIAGILTNNSYIRIATAGLPLKALPRRESTCAHTVNQQSGSVFWLDDMAHDWRFKSSPHTEIGGLKSYAGTQLRFRTSTGDDVALGSLCIAANEANQPFTTERKDALVRFAAMFTDEIIIGARQVRHQMRQKMTQLIAQISARSNEPNIEQFVIDTVQAVYPEARINIQTSASGMINVRGRGPFSYNNIPDGIWEDSDYLDQLILTHNQEELVADQSVRALVGRCSQLPIPRYLVVDSMEVELIFDDIDAWFIERSSLTLCNILQRRFLEEALRAKETFLRGITHELRTPIHGVLASTDLLAEELAARDAFLKTSSTDMLRYTSSKDNAESILSTINSSGKELLATVNGILKLNRWADLHQSSSNIESYKLEDLEQDLCKDMSEALTLSHHERTTIIFDNRLEPPTPIKTDPELLRECLSALVQNAMSYTEQGYINIILSQAEDNSLVVDIVDTGCGIKEEDQQRIFEACERANTTIRGAGLGLTLASKIATRMNGSVRLVRSTAKHGSHFRASFPGLIESSSATVEQRSILHQLNHLPKNWIHLQAGEQEFSVTTPLSHYLAARGISQGHVVQDSLIVIDYTEDSQALDNLLSSVDKLLASLGKTQIKLCLLPAGRSPEHLADVAKKHDIIFSSGPFTSNKMEELLKRIDELYCDISKGNHTTQTSSTYQSVSDLLRSSSLEIRPRTSAPLPSTKDEPVTFRHILPHALLVDDNSINLHILKVYCEKRGIPYTVAMDGNQAVQAFTSRQGQEPFNLILMDLQMPDCDGIRATQRIRDLEAEAAAINGRKPAVIFMVTGQDSVEDRRRSEAAGCDAFYVKPVGIKLLDQAIKAYFRDFAPGSKKSIDGRPGDAGDGPGTSQPSASPLPAATVNGAHDEPLDATRSRGRGLAIDSNTKSRDESLRAEVRRASENCQPRSEAVLATSPLSDVSVTGLQTVMDEKLHIKDGAMQ